LHIFRSAEQIPGKGDNATRLPGCRVQKKSVDKQTVVWLNMHYQIPKDFDGKSAPVGCFREPAVGVSRCGRQAAVWFLSRLCKMEKVVEPVFLR